MENTYYIEMPDDYRQLSEAYHRHFAPQGLEELALVDDLVRDFWVRKQVLEFTSSHSPDPSQPGVNELLETAARRLPVVEHRLAETLGRLQRLQKRRLRSAKPAKLASFRRSVSRAQQPPAPPKTASGEWVN